MADPLRSLPPSWDQAISPRPLRPPDVSAPPASPTPRAVADDDGTGAVGGEDHRRLLVGNLVVRRVAYRSVARVAWPFFGALYALVLAGGAVAWNVAALGGWSPDADGLEVFWVALAAGVVAVPTLVLLAVGVAALYNAISERTGGLEIAVVSPRRYRRTDATR